VLVVTRLPSESIRIGGQIRIIVLGVKGRQVRIGVDAPLNIVVDREEIHLRKQAEAKWVEAKRWRDRKSRNDRPDDKTEVSHDTNWK
jgi:carbon storage regulator